MFNLFNKSSVGKGIHLDEVTELLNELRLPTSLVFTPTNLKEEKAKFFDSDSYNPTFEYRIIKNENSKILGDLKGVSEIVDVDPRISEFYIDLIQAKIQMNDMLYAVGDNERFTKYSIDRFGMPSPILFRNAARILRGRTKIYNLVDTSKVKSKRVLRYDEISQVFEKIFEAYDLRGWTTEKSMNISKNGVKVGIKRKEVLMDPDIEKKPFELRKTIVHELTHVFRSVNGAATGIDALAKPNLPKYLEVEEGLAGHNEEMMGVLTSSALRIRAAKTWAMYYGRDMTFRELYNLCLGIMPRKTAFKTVYKIKRGLGDTSQPGLYTKDLAYFRGFRIVRRKVKKDKTLYRKLHAGKIDFKQVKWVDDGLIPKPKYVPSREKYEKVFKEVGI